MCIPFSNRAGRPVIVELLDGEKLSGVIHKWGRKTIWVKNKKGIFDVPKEIIKRSLFIV